VKPVSSFVSPGFNTVYGQPQADLTGAAIINPYGRGSDLENKKTLRVLSAFGCPVQFFAEDKRSVFNWGGSRFKIQIYSININ